MANPVQIKVCGIRTAAQAQQALQLGVDYVGINGYKPSPRSLPMHNMLEPLQVIPEGKAVFVDVMPSLDKLEEADAMGFYAFQIHGTIEALTESAHVYANAFGAGRIWLAPKLPPGESFPDKLLAYANTWLVDAYAKGLHGGTGKTSDWPLFRSLSSAYPEKLWLLAGGLSPENISEALSASHARFVDVNSGVEHAPGDKDMAQLARFIEAVREYS